MPFNPDSGFLHASIFSAVNNFTTLNLGVSKSVKVVDIGQVARIGLMKLIAFSLFNL